MGKVLIVVFWSKTKSANYHDEMNSQYCMEWLTDTLYQHCTDQQSSFRTVCHTIANRRIDPLLCVTECMAFRNGWTIIM